MLTGSIRVDNLARIDLVPHQYRIYQEWFRRSSRYRDAYIYLYIAKDKSNMACKVGISVRKPQVRLWDIGYLCMHEWLLPNECSRKIESFITAKYCDKWLRKDAIGNNINTISNGHRECYPYGLVTELRDLILKLLEYYKDDNILGSTGSISDSSDALVNTNYYDNININPKYGVIDSRYNSTNPYVGISRISFSDSNHNTDSRVIRARKFMLDIDNLRNKKYKDMSVFVVTDGASLTRNRGSTFVKLHRDYQVSLENKYGYDPNEDWVKDGNMRNYSIVGSSSSHILMGHDILYSVSIGNGGGLNGIVAKTNNNRSYNSAKSSGNTNTTNPAPTSKSPAATSSLLSNRSMPKNNRTMATVNNSSNGLPRSNSYAGKSTVVSSTPKNTTRGFGLNSLSNRPKINTTSIKSSSTGGTNAKMMGGTARPNKQVSLSRNTNRSGMNINTGIK